MGTKQDDHNRGQRIGARAGLLERLAADVILLDDDPYKKGFDNGVKYRHTNRPLKSRKVGGGGGEGEPYTGSSSASPFVIWVLAIVGAFALFFYTGYKLDAYARAMDYRILREIAAGMIPLGTFCGGGALIGGVMKGRPVAGFFLGLLGPLGWIITLCLPDPKDYWKAK